MRRTLLAVGFAVLVSMLLAPHGDKYGIKGFGPFFSEYTLGIEREIVPDWAVASNPFADLIPAKHSATQQHLAVHHVGKVMIDMLPT